MKGEWRGTVVGSEDKSAPNSMREDSPVLWVTEMRLFALVRLAVDNFVNQKKSKPYNPGIANVDRSSKSWDNGGRQLILKIKKQVLR